ncbi:TKL protein kinase [Saprolegnia parasitica CBS 223.65]|uniref:TKL protein kinase n=1 Tax=Saprolegnia parasitica (strain CBS 223.65) TaxID=695850 RepID=A0A067CCU0_SAPPC|nr:TKL protein kinase [Saprolegnia parasitica CBS 223.65]KDO27005.1 TKL protein kinase [Saprolegnia parasitica CBS 223.65]|eukprot:XP_012202382.1 TKL protein kinase [Saprolegnia parasitica CBS 223.65]
MLGRLAALSLGANAVLGACPYQNYASTFTVSYCVQPDAILCIVDSNCKPTVMYTKKMDVFKDSTLTDQIIIKDKAQYLAQLPRLSNTYIQFFGSVREVGDLSNDSMVALLDFQGNPGIDLSKAAFPSSMTRLSLAQCQLSTLPTTVPYGQLSEFYGWDNNFTSLDNIDFRNAVEIKFNSCPRLTTFNNVSVSNRLSKFYFDDSNFTTFLVDQPTYTALQSVPTFAVGGIDVSASCKAPNTIQPLKTKYSVCVMPASTPTMAPISSAPGTSTPAVTSSTTQTAWIVGATLGAVAVVGLCVAALVCFRRKRRAANPATESTINRSYGRTETMAGDTSSTGHMVSAAFNMEDLELLRLDERALVKLQSIAKGAYGEVYRGEYKGQEVAIKCMLQGKNSRDDILSLIDEIKLTAKLDCPYVVQTIGASWRVPSELQMVLEWMDRGDLKSVLEKTKPNVPGGVSTTFPWEEKFQTMLAIADGLVYLHSLDVIHRDLKSRNVLMDSQKGTKLTDFGASREVTTETMTIGVGTYRWMAPEILQDNHYTTAADIYSFGMVISELNTHFIPYSDMRNDKGNALVDTAIMSRVIQGTIQPTFTASIPSWVRTLALECLRPHPEDRPSATLVAHTIRQQLKVGL